MAHVSDLVLDTQYRWPPQGSCDLFRPSGDATEIRLQYFHGVPSAMRPPRFVDHDLTCWLLASIQVPYLLSLAGLLCSYLPAFPFSTAVFHVTGKLDQAFATLLSPSHDQSPDTRADNHRVSVTEKVRIKSLIEETRVMAVQTASRSGHAASVLDLSMDEDSEDVEDESEQDLRHEHDTGETAQSLSISLGLARIYKRSLEILGDSLGGALSPAQERLGTHTEPESGTPVAEG